MLVVLSQEKKRSPSGSLRQKFERFYSKCLDENSSDYCMKGVPEFGRVSRVQTAVVADLNETAKETMPENPTDLEVEIHAGKMNQSLWEEDLKKIDKISMSKLPFTEKKDIGVRSEGI